MPVFSFGENDVFDQLMPNPEGTRLRSLQNRFKKMMGFSLPFFAGRGIFNYDYGFLPKRKRIVSVGMRPLLCPADESTPPSQCGWGGCMDPQSARRWRARTPSRPRPSWSTSTTRAT